MNWAGAMWALHPLSSRSTFHSSLCTFHFPQGPLFTFHLSLFTSLRDRFSLFTLHFSLPEGTLFTLITQCGALAFAARSDGTCSVLRRASQRTAFLQGLLCMILCAVLLGVGLCSVRPFSLGAGSLFPGCRLQSAWRRDGFCNSVAW